jgi:tetratricopeptide (TPR) repeat protein
MPSHIFTQLGLWQESIATNIKAATAARDYAAKVKMEGPWSEELHALDYMSYAYLQQADDHHAREIRDRVLELRTFKPTRNAMAYPYNSIPARFALERRQWREATELVETWPGMFPVAVALTHFARGYGAARLGDLAGARRELAALEALQPTPADAADQHCGTPAASLEPKIEIQRRAISAWIAQLEGDAAGAERLMRAAADLEDATDDGPVTPGSLVPAREMLGELLLVKGRSEQARAEFETTIRIKPGLFGPRYGAARAALAAGDRRRAAAHYAKLLEGTDPTSDRPEILEARAFVLENPPPR